MLTYCVYPLSNASIILVLNVALLFARIELGWEFPVSKFLESSRKKCTFQHCTLRNVIEKARGFTSNFPKAFHPFASLQ